LRGQGAIQPFERGKSEFSGPVSVRLDDMTAGLRRAIGWVGKRERLIVTMAVLFVATAGTALAIHEGAHIRFLDEQQYVSIARHIADNGRYSLDGIRPTAYRPPVWPLVLATFRWAGLGLVWARLFNVLCLALMVVGVWRLGRRIGGQAAGALAAVVCAIYPLYLYTSSTLYPQALGTALLVGAVLAAMAAVRQSGDHPWRALGLAGLAGLAGGALMLAIPVLVASAGMIILWFIVARGRKALPLVAAALAATAVLPLAWMMRNDAQLHSAVPLSTSDGVNMLLGNSEHAGPGTGTLANISRYTVVAAQRRLDEVGQDKYYRSSALSWIKHNVPKATVLYGEKTLNYFNFRNQLATPGESSRAKDILSATSYLPVLALALVGLALRRRRPISKEGILLYGLFLLNAPFMALFFTRVRFRLPLDTLAIVMAAVALVGLFATDQRSPEWRPLSGKLS
jgi:4-amino-4-deoxy-L-arabinose transferase-like glycosyltransferase